MTKPIIYLMLLVGGAFAAGAGVVTYGEWQQARQTAEPAAPAQPVERDVAVGEAPAKEPPVAAEESLAAPAAPASEAPPRPAAPQDQVAALPEPGGSAAEEEAPPAAAEPAAPQTTAPAAMPREPAQPVRPQRADEPGESAAASDRVPPAPAEAPPLAEPPPARPQPADSAALQPDEPPSPVTAPTEVPEAAPAVPSFDIVRVEPTGEAVIAGNAPGGAKVQVLSNGEVVAETSADAGGNWVALPELPLRPGSHDLTIRATREDGEETQSEERVAIAVPEEPGEEVVAVLDVPGRASEVLAAPGREAPRAMAEPPQKLEPMATAPEVAESRTPHLSVDAVEAEGRTMYVAGAGDPGALVRVYVDGELVGEAQAGAGGRWLVEATRALEEGRVTVRADQLKAGSVQVEARAEVPFMRRLDMAALVPAARAGAGAGESAEGAGLPQPGAVIIRRGDNLWTISRRTYGRGVRYTTIYRANEDQIRDPHWIYPGQVFVLPTGDRAWTEN